MGVGRITCEGSLYGVERWANVFHVVTPSTSFAPIDILDIFEDFYATAHSGGGTGALNPCRGAASGVTGVTLDKLAYQDVHTPLIPVEKLVSHSGGQNTAGGLPVANALVISWVTPSAGKSYRGRTYLPPWHENQNDDSVTLHPVPTAATVTAIAAQCKGLLDDLIGNDTPLCVYSRKLDQGNEIVGGYIDNNWDTQRGRGRSLPSVRTSFSS